MQLFCVVGRTEKLALAELEAIFGSLPNSWSLTILPSGIAILNPSKDGVSLTLEGLTWLKGMQDRLGGTTRIGLVLGSGRNLGELLEEQLLAIAGERKRVEFALSGFDGGDVANKLGMELKRNLKGLNVSARYVRNLENNASTVQVWHEKLAASLSQEGIDSHKAEMCFWKDNNEWVVGRTLTVQNIESYSNRDFNIPRPDPYNGMVPPKLAQMLVNTAVGSATTGVGVYDPFCGSGRIVSEAWLMGLAAGGSDANTRIVEDSQQNLKWISQHYTTLNEYVAKTWVADARKVEANEQLKQYLAEANLEKWHVITEPYLGKPLRSPLETSEVRGWLEDVVPLYEDFLVAWTAESLRQAGITALPASFMVVFPCATVKGSEKGASVYEVLVDRFPRLGYSCKQLFRYGRPSALIQREIVLFTYDGSK